VRLTSAVLFDIDGTLIDSRRSLLATYERVCDVHNITANFEGFSSKLGATLGDILGFLHPKIDLDSLVSCFKLNSAVFESQLRAYEGALEMVQHCAYRADVCCYVTSKDYSRAVRALEITGFPSLPVFSPTPEVRPKPFPDLFGLVRARYKFTTGIYLGDTEEDYVASNSAGLDFIWASWGYGEINILSRQFATAGDTREAIMVADDWFDRTSEVS